MDAKRANRQAFTLIELIVVMLIIGILMAMSAAAVGKFITVQQQSNTEMTIRKVYSKLMTQWESVIRSAREENMATTIGSANAAYITTLAGGDGRRARVIYIKARLKQEFPISFGEATSPGASWVTGPLPFKQAYFNKFSGKTITGSGLTLTLTAASGPVTAVALGSGGTGYPASTTFTVMPLISGAGGCTVSATTSAAGIVTSVSLTTAGTGYSSSTVPAVVVPAAYESSACLLEALKQGRRGNPISSDDFGSQSVKQFNGVDCLVDGWGTPLQFFRWPTGSGEVNGLAPPPQPTTSGALTPPTTVRDQQDPDGLLLSNQWYLASDTGMPVPQGSLGLDFEYYFHPVHNATVTFNTTTHTATGMYAYFMVPVLASAGPNKHLGLYVTDMTADGTGSDTDNLYSYRLLPPGVGGD